MHLVGHAAEELFEEPKLLDYFVRVRTRALAPAGEVRQLVGGGAQLVSERCQLRKAMLGGG